ncbi:calcium-binding protein [Paracoccus lutimaris]|uniref:Hemolysin type calcium-binding protein n=1 Tax=Paracoccus lutimaris TaxID=1490030 RepID=A0A368YKJ8_9RHOB|nr:hypothetical protein [Paracoccus lutimaris]RCW79427.1 hemolysin type calcium-binding protein [Paracoccus lutimaris]
MSPMLLALIGSVSALALFSIFDDDDDSSSDDQPITATNEDGEVTGTDGNDTIISTRDSAVATFDLRPFETDEGAWQWPDSDSSWDPEDPVPEGGLLPGLTALNGGAGNDSITATGVSTDVDGGAGNDTITANSDGLGTVGPTTMFVRGGDGNDLITASGSNMLVTGGDGTDTLSLGGMTESSVVISGDDIVTGRGDGEDGLVFIVEDGGSFTGNASEDLIILRESSSADGGAGDDWLRTDYGYSGSSTLTGGAGNDLLVGNHARAHGPDSESTLYTWNIGNSNDVLNGGTGDDQIYFDLADTVTGGAGADLLTGFADVGQTSVVTDFTAGEDVLRVNIEPTTEAGTISDFANVTVVEQDGNTLIQISGSDVVRIEGATGLSVGYEVGHPSPGEPPTYTDRDGNPVDAASLDVVINNFETVWR